MSTFLAGKHDAAHDGRVTGRIILGIHGLAGVGKSTLADWLIDQHDFHRMKFADPLKRMLRALGLEDVHIEGRLKEAPCDLLCGRTPRFAMQTLGTEWGRRTIGGEFWTNAWKHAVSLHGENVVCDDVRFPNEAQAVRDMGGKIIVVTRPSTLNVGQHESEAHSIEGDFTIPNAGTVRQLCERASSILWRMRAEMPLEQVS